MSTPPRIIVASLLALTLFSCRGNDKGPGNVPSVTWQTAIGGSDDERAERAILLSDGGILAAGLIANFSRTDNDAYLLRTDYNGSKLWDRRFVTPRLDAANDIKIAGDGRLYTVGSIVINDSTGTNALLIQADTQGDLIRSRQFEQVFRGAYDEEGIAVLPTADGGGVMVGTTQDQVDGALRTFLVRFDSTGEALHQHVLGGPLDDVVHAAVLAPDYTILIAGAEGDTGTGRTDAMLTCADTNGSIIWRRKYLSAGSSMLNTLALDADGTVIIAGSADTSGTGDADFYIARTDPQGHVIWATTHGGRWADEANAVVVTLDRGIVVAGETGSFGAQATDVYLIKVDALGLILWEKRYGAQSFDEAADLLETADSGFIVAGTTRSIGAGGMDVYLIKTDAEGNAPDPELIP